MLAAEGQVHKRQRRVGTPAFSIQNMRALVPVTFRKAVELRDRWIALIQDAQHGLDGEKWKGSARLDVCHWVSRATFDVIGLAGTPSSHWHVCCSPDTSQALTTISTPSTTSRTSSSWRTRRCLRSLYHNKEVAFGSSSSCMLRYWTGSRCVLPCQSLGNILTYHSPENATRLSRSPRRSSGELLVVSSKRRSGRSRRPRRPGLCMVAKIC